MAQEQCVIYNRVNVGMQNPSALPLPRPPRKGLNTKPTDTVNYQHATYTRKSRAHRHMCGRHSPGRGSAPLCDYNSRQPAVQACPCPCGSYRRGNGRLLTFARWAAPKLKEGEAVGPPPRPPQRKEPAGHCPAPREAPPRTAWGVGGPSSGGGAAIAPPSLQDGGAVGGKFG